MCLIIIQCQADTYDLYHPLAHPLIIVSKICISEHIKLFPPVAKIFLHFCFFSRSSEVFWEKKKSPLRGVRACRDQGYGGRWEGDGHYWQWWRESALLAAESFMSETEKDSQRKTWHERGTVTVKEKLRQPLERTLRLTPSHSPPFSIFHVLRRLFSYLMLFCSLLLRQKVLERKKPLVYSGHTTVDRC